MDPAVGIRKANLPAKGDEGSWGVGGMSCQAKWKERKERKRQKKDKADKKKQKRSLRKNEEEEGAKAIEQLAVHFRCRLVESRLLDGDASLD